MPTLPDQPEIDLFTRPLDATIRPPGSKSLTNRALLLAALAEGTSTLRQPLIADDTRRMLDALVTLGLNITVENGGEIITVVGCAGRLPKRDVTLNLGNAGTAMRTLAAACCLGEGRYRLDGVARMRQRPIGQLVDALRRIGASIDYDGEDGYPPITIHGTGALHGGDLELGALLSSQYITALAIVAPYMQSPLTIQFSEPPISAPYIAMTLGLMAQFDVRAKVTGDFTRIDMPTGRYKALDYAVEPDASNASYFLAAAAITAASKCTIEGLGRTSLQGDVGFADVLHLMGAGLLYGPDFITVIGPSEGEQLKGVDIDMNHMPDMALTLAAIAPLCDGPTAIRNVGNLRVKETDRLAALRTELTKLGAAVTIDGDDLLIAPPGRRLKAAAIDTYDDHRMAMSFAVTAMAHEGIAINDPACVNKTFPDFFEYLDRLRRTGTPDRPQ